MKKMLLYDDFGEAAFKEAESFVLFRKENGWTAERQADNIRWEMFSCLSP